MNKFRLSTFAVSLSFSLSVAAPLQAQQPQNYEITQVADGLYRAATSSHRTVFLVTEEGIILADPIHTDFSTWLKSELQQRFGVPVRYVLYSHHHWDHASGGAVFADTATFVAHEDMAAALAAPLPSNATVLDASGNGVLERGEASGGFAENFDRLDTDQDGGLSGAEINVDIHPPELLYSDRMTVSLGGERVELIHPEPAHSSDTTILYFPEQRVGFAVDYINVRRLPGSFDPYPFDQYVSAVATMFALDIDIVVPGHGNVGQREDLAEYMGFLRDLQTEVAAAIADGQTLQQAQQSVELAEYSGWLLFDERKANVVAGAYAILSGTR
jgi:glyoxylase-like metal-dependent hydrolase (beta-lactamase superfamily II)